MLIYVVLLRSALCSFLVELLFPRGSEGNLELAAEQCKWMQMAYSFNLMRPCALYVFQTDFGLEKWSYVVVSACVVSSNVSSAFLCIPVSASGIGAFAQQATPGSAGAAKSATKFLR